MSMCEIGNKTWVHTSNGEWNAKESEKIDDLMMFNGASCTANKILALNCTSSSVRIFSPSQYKSLPLLVFSLIFLFILLIIRFIKIDVFTC